jgi:hypothetical protein
MVVEVCVVGMCRPKVHLNQLGADMKTRQEMIYDFMVSLSSNSAIFKDWESSIDVVGGYGEHLQALAAEMADNYLRNL